MENQDIQISKSTENNNSTDYQIIPQNPDVNLLKDATLSRVTTVLGNKDMNLLLAQFISEDQKTSTLEYKICDKIQDQSENSICQNDSSSSANDPVTPISVDPKSNISVIPYSAGDYIDSSIADTFIALESSPSTLILHQIKFDQKDIVANLDWFESKQQIPQVFNLLNDIVIPYSTSSMVAISNGNNELKLSYSNLYSFFSGESDTWYSLNADSLGLSSPFCPVDIKNALKYDPEQFYVWVYSDCKDGTTIPQMYTVGITVENRKDRKSTSYKITATKIIKTIPIEISCEDCNFKFCAGNQNLAFFDNSKGQSFTLAIPEDGLQPSEPVNNQKFFDQSLGKMNTFCDSYPLPQYFFYVQTDQIITGIGEDSSIPGGVTPTPLTSLPSSATSLNSVIFSAFQKSERVAYFTKNEKNELMLNSYIVGTEYLATISTSSEKTLDVGIYKGEITVTDLLTKESSTSTKNILEIFEAPEFSVSSKAAQPEGAKKGKYYLTDLLDLKGQCGTVNLEDTYNNDPKSATVLFDFIEPFLKKEVKFDYKINLYDFYKISNDLQVIRQHNNNGNNIGLFTQNFSEIGTVYLADYRQFSQQGTAGKTFAALVGRNTRSSESSKLFFIFFPKDGKTDPVEKIINLQNESFSSSIETYHIQAVSDDSDIFYATIGIRDQDTPRFYKVDASNASNISISELTFEIPKFPKTAKIATFADQNSKSAVFIAYSETGQPPVTMVFDKNGYVGSGSLKTDTNTANYDFERISCSGNYCGLLVAGSNLQVLLHSETSLDPQTSSLTLKNPTQIVVNLPKIQNENLSEIKKALQISVNKSTLIYTINLNAIISSISPLTESISQEKKVFTSTPLRAGLQAIAFDCPEEEKNVIGETECLGYTNIFKDKYNNTATVLTINTPYFNVKTDGISPFQNAVYNLKFTFEENQEEKSQEMSLETVFSGKDPIVVPVKPKTPEGSYEEVGTPYYYAGESMWYWWLLGIIGFLAPLIFVALVASSIFGYIYVKQPEKFMGTQVNNVMERVPGMGGPNAEEQQVAQNIEQLARRNQQNA